MNITVKAEKPQDDQIAANVNVDAKDVDAAIEQAYKDISHKYNFQGFRKGHTPRPVIDSMVGREAVMAQATNSLLNQVEPQMLDELDIVPLGDVDFGSDPSMVEEHEPYEITATIKVMPDYELESYDAPEIDLPPENATDAEIDRQIDQLMSYHTTYEDIDKDRAVKKGDLISVDVENVENAEAIAGKGRMLSLDAAGLPEEFDKALIGAKKGDTKEVTWTNPKATDDAEATTGTCKVTINGIKKSVVPELTDDFVKTGFGFDDVAALRDAVKQEIEQDKKQSLPGLKEDRIVTKLAASLKGDEIPQEYSSEIFNELAQQILGQLQSQGMTLDTFLQARGISAEQFIADLHSQADERARQSLALDSLASKLGLEATEDDIKKEFTDAGVDVKKFMEQFKNEGRLPALRKEIKRSKALDWLLENAKVNEVDEAAKTDEPEKKPAAKKAAKKAPAKKPAAKKDAPDDGADKKDSADKAE